MRSATWWLTFSFLGITLLVLVPAFVAQTIPPIGTIQGRADESAYNGQFVTFRGVVTGQYEDRNTRGIVYYTLFVQEMPAASDGDPATSDGIAVFLGRQKPYVSIGDLVLVSGRVTEFYGFTEIDDRGLAIAIEKRGEALPSPTIINPPADIAAQAAYFEALEGMRVTFDGPVVVAGPAHEGCGFAVIAEEYASTLPVIRQAEDDSVGRVIPVLYPSDVDCADLPQLKVGDTIKELSGVVVYNFDQFKILLDASAPMEIEPAELLSVDPLPALDPDQISIVSLNAEDYFDTTRDTTEDGEPVLTEPELSIRQAKLKLLLSDVLNCPTLVGLQEIEKASLPADLAEELTEICGFTYAVSHLDSPDARGIDNALLSDPRRVSVQSISLRQTCSPVPTGIEDASVTCDAGQEPLFGRPPLQVEAIIDDEPYTLFINHFKSKRGGEIETGLERIRQAVYLNGLAAELLAADPQAKIIALGDFNDTELSPALALLSDPQQGGRFFNALSAVPFADRYTYNFGGVSELIDTILLSPALADEPSQSFILHLNTDYPSTWRMEVGPDKLAYRFSDHDIPVLILGELPVEPTPTIEITPSPPSQPEASPIPTNSPVPTPALTATPPPARITPTALPGSPPTFPRSIRMMPGVTIVIGIVIMAAIGLFWLRRAR